MMRTLFFEPCHLRSEANLVKSIMDETEHRDATAFGIMVELSRSAGIVYV